MSTYSYEEHQAEILGHTVKHYTVSDKGTQVETQIEFSNEAEARSFAKHISTAIEGVFTIASAKGAVVAAYAGGGYINY